MTVEYQIRYYNTEVLRDAEMRGEPIDRDDWILYQVCADGKTAAARVEELKTNYSFRDLTLVIVRYDPAAGNRNWRTRELTRLYDGTYKLVQGTLPIETPEEYKQNQCGADQFWQENYAGRTFHDLLITDLPHHFTHLSQSDEKKIAFTTDDAKGKRDKQTVLSAFTYVDRYLSNHWPHAVQSLFFDAIGGFDLHILYAETSEEMAAIYQDCDTSRMVGSCMSHKAESYDTWSHEEQRHIHPAEAYAGGDLKLAYVRENGDTGAIWGRALVWPERGTYGRIYSTNAALFRKALKVAGYTSGEDSAALEGAKLKRIMLSDGKFVLPYIDNNFAVDWDGESLTICEGGNIGAEGTSGSAYLDAREKNYCDYCDDFVHEDVQTVRDGRNHEILACESCVENYFTYCDDCETVHHNVRMPYSEVYCRSFCNECYSETHSYCDNCRDEFRSEDVSWHEDSDLDLCNECYAAADSEADEEDDEESAAAPLAITGGELWLLEGRALPNPYPSNYTEWDVETHGVPPNWQSGMKWACYNEEENVWYLWGQGTTNGDRSFTNPSNYVANGRYIVPLEATYAPTHTQEALAA